MGVPIIFEKENINTLDPKCGLILTVMASLAEQEIISMSKNQKWAARKRFANGSIELTRILGYSYEKGKLTVIPHEAAIVREIFDLYLQGNGVTKIAAILEAKGYRTVHNRTDWSRKSVLSVLKNEKYTGNCLLQKNICDMKTKKPNKGELPQYYIENSHEAIIPMEDFERVQKLMQVKVDKFHPNGVDSGGFRYPLSGKIKCGVCGATYKRKTAAKGQTYESIKWTCVVKDVKGKANCDSHEIKNDVVEKLLIEAYNESLDKKYAYSGAAEEYEKLKALLATEQELKTLHTKGYIADAQYRAECDRLLNEIKSREATIQTLQSRKLGEKRFEKSAVLCNEFWQTKCPIDKLYAENYFHNAQQGKKAKQFAKCVYQYFMEKDEIKDDMEFWFGNYQYIKDYRNKMTHRNSPSITTISNFDFDFRPPTMFVLKRATEVYLKVYEFIKDLLDEIMEYFAANNIFD